MRATGEGRPTTSSIRPQRHASDRMAGGHLRQRPRQLISGLIGTRSRGRPLHRRRRVDRYMSNHGATFVAKVLLRGGAPRRRRGRASAHPQSPGAYPAWHRQLPPSAAGTGGGLPARGDPGRADPQGQEAGTLQMLRPEGTSELTGPQPMSAHERPGRYGRQQCPKPVDVGQSS